MQRNLANFSGVASTLAPLALSKNAMISCPLTIAKNNGLDPLPSILSRLTSEISFTQNDLLSFKRNLTI